MDKLIESIKEIEKKIEGNEKDVKKAIKHYVNVRIKKTKPIVANLTKYEERLIIFRPPEEQIIKKKDRNKSGKDEWKHYLKPDEKELIESLNKKDPIYKKIRRNCAARLSYSIPENKVLQDKRNKLVSDKKKLIKKENLIKILPEILNDRVEKKKILIEKDRKKGVERYHSKKTDPKFVAMDKERCKNYREKNPLYRKINAALAKEGKLVLSQKAQLRREKIKELLIKYETLSDFRLKNKLDYNWVIANGLRIDLFSGFPDLLKREKYKEEKEIAKDPKIIFDNKKSKAIEKSFLCHDMFEYRTRFLARYKFCFENNLLEEIEKNFKTKE